MKNLIKISKKYKTTKKELGFIKIYNDYLKSLKNKKIKLLEIGFSKYSIKMYKEYLPKAKIIGLDIREQKLTLKNVDLFTGNQNDLEILKRIVSKYKKFDVIIDDGSHINSDIKYTFNFMFNYLNEGGLYFIEDLQTSYISRWKYGGDPVNMNNKKTTMNFLRSLADRMHYQEFDNPFYKRMKYDGLIGFVHIFKNIAVIQKKKNFYNSNLSYKNSIYLGMIKKRKDFDLSNYRDLKNYSKYFLRHYFRKISNLF